MKTGELESPKQVKTKPAPKTRSGRVVRFPKHIEKVNSFTKFYFKFF